MEIGKFLNKSATTAKSITKSVANTYHLHVKKKAIKEVAQTLKSAGLSPSDIEEDEYEVMINDACKEIKSTHSKRAAQIGFSLLGLDLLFGL